jgi:DNA polymerase-3 subunit delta'
VPPEANRATKGRREPDVSGGVGWPDWSDPNAVQRLRGIIRDGRIGHAYLLSGPRGVGKSELARSFAQALCCVQPDPGDRSLPCGRCRVCRNIVRGAHADVEVFSLEAQALLADKADRGSTITIETVRRLRAAAALLPLESSRRLLIVEDAETLLEPAQQAMLKTLEEPPPLVTLLLLTDEAETLLPTVRSRCQEIAVRPVPESAVARALVSRGLEEALAQEIATLSRGAPAWALAAASDQKLLQARRDERDSAASWLASSRHDRLVTAYALGEQFAKRHSSVIGVVQAAAQLLRADMIQAAAVAETSSVAGAAQSARALSESAAASLRCLADLETNARPRLALETMVLAWPIQEPR